MEEEEEGRSSGGGRRRREKKVEEGNFEAALFVLVSHGLGSASNVHEVGKSGGPVDSDLFCGFHWF